MNSVKDEDDITVSEDPNGPKIGLEELKGPSGREGCETPRIQMVQSTQKVQKARMSHIKEDDEEKRAMGWGLTYIYGTNKSVATLPQGRGGGKTKI